MTDADEFTAILNAFPLTSAQVDALCKRAHRLVNKRPSGLTGREWNQLRELSIALQMLRQAADYIERDVDPPDDDIPF